MNIIRIATRKSPLALCQANYVKEQIKQYHPDLEIELVATLSQGDRILNTPLAKIGGKGLFVKELENLLLTKQADIAVHSMKDVPMILPDELSLEVVCSRENPRDAFVSNNFANLDELPAGALVGTSSLRRHCQILEQRPDLKINFLRGNVDTRLRKLDAGNFDAIILAAAGLIRLRMKNRISSVLSTSVSLPAVGQGAIGIEFRTDAEHIREFIEPLRHKKTAIAVGAERAMNRRLNGSCQVPIAGFAVLNGDTLSLRGLVGRPDGSTIYRSEVTRSAFHFEQAGFDVADSLLAQGAGKILRELFTN